MQSFPRSVVPSFCRALFPLFPPFVFQFFYQIFWSKSKNSFKNEFPTLYCGGRVPKNMCDFSKKKFFFVVPAFCRSRLLSPKNFFFRKIFFVKIENSFKNGFPTLFYRGRVPKNMCDFSKKKYFFSSFPPLAAGKKNFSKSRQAKKIRKKFFSQNQKFPAYLNSPTPK